MTTRWRIFVAAGMLLAVGGCVGPFKNPFAPSGPPAPQVLHPSATLDEVIAAVNANSARVRSYAAHGATITPIGMPLVPSLTGNIMIERPARFRIRAGTVLSGAEIDLGGNEQLLWMWVKQSEPQAVYLCRRDQFAASQAQHMMPVDPQWLPAALGLLDLDPQGQHEPLRLLPDGTMEIRSALPGPSGTLTRVCVIDATRAWVLQQHVYDAQGAPVATAIASQHRYFPEHQVSLPQRVEVRAPAAQLALMIDVGQLLLNTHLGDAAQLWMPPQIQGVPQVDIAGGDSTLGPPDPKRIATTKWQPVYRLPLANP